MSANCSPLVKPTGHIEVNRRTLSSRWTPFMKFLVPTVWGLVWGCATAAMWLELYRGRGGMPPPDGVKWVFLLLWIAILAFMLWACGGLKRIQADDNNLYISNYLREVRVPLSAIRDVTEIRWINIHPVTIHFGSDTPFGQRISFMPKARFGFALRRSPHPVVQELKALAAASNCPGKGLR